MCLTKEDFSILDQFAFEVPPVGIKFYADRPDRLERIGEKMALCEMLRKAQQGHVFFADQKNHTCEAGSYVLGLSDAMEPFVSGKFGAGLQIFEEPRSASRLYHYIPRIGKGVVRAVGFSPLSRLPFDPDVLILLADAAQTEILLRASSYRTGKMWISRFSAAIGCAWICVYPYLTGELNYAVTGLGHGMRRRKIFPEGKQIVSIPFDMLRSILQSLRDMPWVLPAFEANGDEFVGRLLTKLGISPPTTP